MTYELRTLPCSRLWVSFLPYQVRKQRAASWLMKIFIPKSYQTPSPAEDLAFMGLLPSWLGARRHPGSPRSKPLHQLNYPLT